jgi:hypothetical protein
MAIGWRFVDLLAATTDDVEATVVDCSTCPVSMQCLAARGGNGFKFPCCGSTAVPVSPESGTRLLVMDCTKNQFETGMPGPTEFSRCPLCSGDIVKNQVLALDPGHRYLPTVHSIIPVAARLEAWKLLVPIAIQFKKNVDIVKAARREAQKK